MKTAIGEHLGRGLVGCTLGVVLSQLGFTDFKQVHAMFTLTDPRLLEAFAGAVALAALGFFLLARHRALPKRPIFITTVPGAVVFGLGWALCGDCPSAALVQIGELKISGVAVTAGIVLGAWIYTKGQGRLWQAHGTCGED